MTYSHQIVGIIYPIQIYISKYVHSPTLCPKGRQKPPTYINPPNVGIIYPISTYIFKWHTLPKLLASYIQYKYRISKYVHSPTLCPKGTQKPSNLHSSPMCWHDISNINIYLQVTYTPQIVGIIYPIQIYISKYVHSPTLCQRADKNPLTYIHSPSVGTIYSIST